jgi:hypothetical protein
VKDQPGRYRAGKRLWQPTDDAVLRRIYPDQPNPAIARRLRRTVIAIYGRAGILGLHKSAAYMAGPHACRLRRGDDVGKRFRFPAGHVPANKGLRRPGYSVGRGRMQETQFKKGERQGVASRNWRPIGSLATDPEGYLRIKVREARPGEAYGFGNVRVWPLLQRHVWAQAHGPIPPGHVIIFRNADKTDVRLENLELITRRALMLRNSVHNLPEPLAKAVQLLGALNRKLRRRARDEEQDRRSA